MNLVAPSAPPHREQKLSTFEARCVGCKRLGSRAVIRVWRARGGRAR